MTSVWVYSVTLHLHNTTHSERQECVDFRSPVEGGHATRWTFGSVLGKSASKTHATNNYVSNENKPFSIGMQQ